VKPFEVIILCGGFGTRLRSVISDVPKPMASIRGRPFLEILLKQYHALGFSRAVLSAGYRANVIRDYFGESYDRMELFYSVDPTPLGTGGAARAGAHLCSGDNVLVCNGDTFVEFDFEALNECWRLNASPIVLTLRVEDTERYGRIELNNGSEAIFVGRGVQGVGFISSGVYFVPRDMFANYTRPAPFSIEEFVFDNAHRRSVNAISANGRFIDIGVPED
jgi:D-glycero-alpha-D-manno-heptose 1-phosphate guanylyltransferase